jgi:hypothetical protein
MDALMQVLRLESPVEGVFSLRQTHRPENHRSTCLQLRRRSLQLRLAAFAFEDFRKAALADVRIDTALDLLANTLAMMPEGRRAVDETKLLLLDSELTSLRQSGR